MRARAYGERNVPTREKQRVDLFAQADAALALVMVRLFVDLLDQEIEVVGGRPSLLELIETRDRHRRVVALRLGELEHSRIKGQALQACRESEVGQIRMERRQRGWWVGGWRTLGGYGGNAALAVLGAQAVGDELQNVRVTDALGNLLRRAVDARDRAVGIVVQQELDHVTIAGLASAMKGRFSVSTLAHEGAFQ